MGWLDQGSESFLSDIQKKILRLVFKEAAEALSLRGK